MFSLDLPSLIFVPWVQILPEFDLNDLLLNANMIVSCNNDSMCLRNTDNLSRLLSKNVTTTYSIHYDDFAVGPVFPVLNYSKINN